MLKVLELFGGIGACSKALKRLNIDYEIVDYVEIDKFAVKSFNAINETNFLPQDICNWDKDLEVDLIFHGSPCQSVSLAGLQHGADKDSGTRSSLMWETVRIVDKLRPKIVVWENVKNILSKKHKHNFDLYLDKMSSLGYKNYYQVLNSKDYGIPQNRERVFTISILGNDGYKFPEGKECKNKINRKYGLYGQTTRWGVYDKNGLAPTITASMGMGGGHIPMIENFEFPPKQELKLKLKDLLDDEVDEKYYLSEKTIKTMLKYNENYKPCGISPTLTTELAHSTGKNLSPKIIKEIANCYKIKNNTKKGYLIAKDGDGCYIKNINKKRGTVQKQSIPTIKTNLDIGVVVKSDKK